MFYYGLKGGWGSDERCGHAVLQARAAAPHPPAPPAPVEHWPEHWPSAVDVRRHPGRLQGLVAAPPAAPPPSSSSRGAAPPVAPLRPPLSAAPPARPPLRVGSDADLFARTPAPPPPPWLPTGPRRVTKALAELPGQVGRRGAVAPYVARRAGARPAPAALSMREVQAEVLGWNYFQQVESGRRAAADVRIPPPPH